MRNRTRQYTPRDFAYAIERGEVEWVARFLKRFPALREATDPRGRPFKLLARQSANPEIVPLGGIAEEEQLSSGPVPVHPLKAWSQEGHRRCRRLHAHRRLPYAQRRHTRPGLGAHHFDNRAKASTFCDSSTVCRTSDSTLFRSPRLRPNRDIVSYQGTTGVPGNPPGLGRVPIRPTNRVGL
jgi:hypothetical protein